MATREVGTPTEFKKPEYYNQELINHLNEQDTAAKGRTNQNKNKAQAGLDKVSDKSRATSGESLFSDQNANIAKTGGKQGMINDKDYSTTLRLAREADAYNSMPVGQIFKNGTRNTGGTQSLGYGFEKPQLNTMEQKVRDQSMALDTQRKQAEQQLQAAIDAKDYDTFKSLIQQYFQTELSDLQIRNVFDQLSYTTALQDITNRNLEEFKKEYGRFFDADTASVIYNMVQKNEPFAMQLGSVLDGQVVPPSKQDQFAADFIDGWLKETNPQTSKDTMEQYNAAMLILQKLGIKYDVEAKGMVKANDNAIANLNALLRQFGQADYSDPYDNSKKK